MVGRFRDGRLNHGERKSQPQFRAHHARCGQPLADSRRPILPPSKCNPSTYGWSLESGQANYTGHRHRLASPRLDDGFVSPERVAISDYRVTARMLIAVPILLVGQVVMDSRFRLIVRHLRRSGLLDSDSLADMDVIIAKLIRWRDSLWPELAIILVVYASIALVFSTHLHENRPWALAGEGASHLLPAGWYYGFCEPTCVPLPYRTEPVEMAFVVLFPIPPGTLEFAINAYSP